MMNKPFLNGLLASTYIFVLTSVMTLLQSRFSNQPDTFLAPVLAISIFTLSAAVMGFLFCLEPILLIIAGKKQQAVKYFLQTTGTFALITIVILILAFSGIFS